MLRRQRTGLENSLESHCLLWMFSCMALTAASLTFDLGREVRENSIQSNGAQVAGPSSGTQYEEHSDLFKRGVYNCVLKSFADVSFDA